MSESYLYTTEAMDAYLKALKPRGILRISRWLFPIPRETLRLCTILTTALRRKGINEPWRHVAIQGSRYWATVLASRDPLPNNLLEPVWEIHSQASGNWCLAFLKDGVPVSRGIVPPAFLSYFSAEYKGSTEQFFREYPYNVRPSCDDQPFFFQYYRMDRLFEDLFLIHSKAVQGMESGTVGSLIRELIQGVWPLVILSSMLFFSVSGWCLLCFFYYRWSVQAPAKEISRWHEFLYFTFTGLGFMMVEMLGIQRSVLLLTHPAEAMMVNTFGLLAGAGCGGILLTRCSGTEKSIARIGLITGILASSGIAFLPSSVWNQLHFLPVSPHMSLFAIFFVLGLGIGLPTPAGLSWLKPHESRIIWYSGANQSGAVIGSVLPVFLGLFLGFSCTSFLTVGLYISALCLTCLWKQPS